MTAAIIPFPPIRAARHLEPGAAALLSMLTPEMAKTFARASLCLSYGGDLKALSDTLSDLIDAHGARGAAEMLGAAYATIAAWAAGAGRAA